MRKSINIKECQDILLNMAVEVKEVCERHDIPFYMLGGTMLGAIRHRGFIPWDDDMDFGVPYECYYELIEHLQKELPERYKPVTYENSKSMHSFFMKVEDKETVVVDVRLDAPLEKQMGLTIDIFPLVSCKKEDFDSIIPEINKVYLLKRRIFIGSTDRKLYKVWAKRILRSIVPFTALDLNRKMKRMIDTIQPGEWICNVSSPHFWDKPLPRTYFYPLTSYPFENTEFLGITDYDEYLGSLYRNYMQLPPKEKQEVHLDNVFYRSKES